MQSTRYPKALGRDQAHRPTTSSGSSRTKEDRINSIARAINEEVIAAQDSIGLTYESLEEKLASDEASAIFQAGDEPMDDDETSESCAKRHLAPLQLPQSDFECAVFSRAKVCEKMAEGLQQQSLSDSLNSLQRNSIDGDSPTFGIVVKLLANLVPLLIALEEYRKKPMSF